MDEAKGTEMEDDFGYGEADLDGDGYSETLAYDTDGDGYVDAAEIDTDADGWTDLLVADTDGDGVADTAVDETELTSGTYATIPDYSTTPGYGDDVDPGFDYSGTSGYSGTGADTGAGFSTGNSGTDAVLGMVNQTGHDSTVLYNDAMDPGSQDPYEVQEAIDHTNNIAGNLPWQEAQVTGDEMWNNTMQDIHDQEVLDDARDAQVDAEYSLWRAENDYPVDPYHDMLND